MITRDQLQTHLHELLQCARFRDYAPNGLQVEGRAEIRRILTAVTASQAAIDAAIDWQADALLVHHGYFWKGEAPQVVGMKKHRLAALLAHDLNLFAYHLPLTSIPNWATTRSLPAILPARQYGNRRMNRSSGTRALRRRRCPHCWRNWRVILHANRRRLARLTPPLPASPGAAAPRRTFCNRRRARARRCSSAANTPSAATMKRGKRGRCTSPAAITPANAPVFAPWANILPLPLTCNSAFLMKKIPSE